MNKTKDEIADLALNYASSDPDGHPSPEGYTEYQRGKLHGYIAGFEAAEPKWISIEQEYPPYYECVLIVDSEMCVSAAWLAIGDDGQLIFTIANTPHIVEKVTHWMPLPSPSKQ